MVRATLGKKWSRSRLTEPTDVGRAFQTLSVDKETIQIEKWGRAVWAEETVHADQLGQVPGLAVVDHGKRQEGMAVWLGPHPKGP